MKAFRDLFFGLLSALASGVIVLGAVSLALAEGMSFQPVVIPPTNTTAPTAVMSAQGQPEITLALSTKAPTLTPTVQPTSAACPAPPGWVAVTIELGDTVESLAAAHGIPTSMLRQMNCLVSDSLLPQTILYLPPLPATATPEVVVAPPTVTPVSCGPPYGWIVYIVRPQDTLFKISLAYGVSVPQLQFANCLGSSTYIMAGQALYVPNVRPIFPTRIVITSTAIPTTATLPAPTSSATVVIVVPTATHTTAPPSSPTATHTTVPTVAPTITNTPTQVVLPTSTSTQVPVPTDPPTATPITPEPPNE